MKIKLVEHAYTLEGCVCGKHPRHMRVLTLVEQHRLGRKLMERPKLILQGAGQMSLILPENTPPSEMEGLRKALEAHQQRGVPVTMFGGVSEIIDNRPINEQNLTKITTCDRSSGRYHTRYIEVLVDGSERILTDERCQADQSGRYDVVEDVPEAADRNMLCYYCYPPIAEPERGHTAGPI